MPRRRRNFNARREFSQLFDTHLKRGQRADTAAQRWRPWTNTGFASAIAAAPNSVANWRNVMSPVPPDDVEPILDTLFGVRPEYAGYRKELKEAWERAKNLVPDDRTELTDDWEIVARYAPTALGEIILHQPRPANSGLETWHLHATLRFDMTDYDHGDQRGGSENSDSALSGFSRPRTA